MYASTSGCMGLILGTTHSSRVKPSTRRTEVDMDRNLGFVARERPEGSASHSDFKLKYLRMFSGEGSTLHEASFEYACACSAAVAAEPASTAKEPTFEDAGKDNMAIVTEKKGKLRSTQC